MDNLDCLDNLNTVAALSVVQIANVWHFDLPVFLIDLRHLNQPALGELYKKALILHQNAVFI